MLDRRRFLALSAALAASAGLPDITLANLPGDQRLIVLVLRGGIDALDVVQPHGDPEFAALRPGLARRLGEGLIELDGFFGLREELKELLPLFKDGELGFAHAVSTPYRLRSHFDGQDTLENGTASAAGARDGWLNRLIGLAGGAKRQYALDISEGGSYLLRGAAPVTAWYPDTDLKLTAQSAYFLRLLYRDDAMFRDALDAAIANEAGDIDMEKRVPRVSGRQLGELAGKMLMGEARVAAFSITGWDSHQNQAKALKRPMEDLAGALLALRAGLGSEWQRTAVVAVSEFGRAARENGTRGTDHGTGGMMILAGGAIRGGAGGKVLSTRWPGLAADRLFEGRDLMPTDDMRRYLSWLLSDLLGISATQVGSVVFPGVEIGNALKLV